MTEDTGHIPTTFPVDPNLSEFPRDSSIRLMTKIQRLAALGAQYCAERATLEPGIETDDWPEVQELFSSIEDDAEMLNNLLNHYHDVQRKSAEGDRMPN